MKSIKWFAKNAKIANVRIALAVSAKKNAAKTPIATSVINVLNVIVNVKLDSQFDCSIKIR